MNTNNKTAEAEYINDLKRRMSQQDPEATRTLCELTGTPVPEFARTPNPNQEIGPELPLD